MTTEHEIADKLFDDLKASLIIVFTKAENTRLKTRVRELEYQVRCLADVG